MTDISTEVVTHALITFSKHHYLLTERQFNYLQSGQPLGAIEIKGNIIKQSNIAEIMTINKYYEEHPDKRPQPKSKYHEHYENLNREPSPNATSRMKEGLLKFYIQERGMTQEEAERKAEVTFKSYV